MSEQERIVNSKSWKWRGTVCHHPGRGWVSQAELRQQYGVSRQTSYRAEHAGYITVRREGGKRFFSRDEARKIWGKT